MTTAISCAPFGSQIHMAGAGAAALMNAATAGPVRVNSPRNYELFERQLLEAVKNSLRYELHANASFLCERLLAQVDNDEVRLLLAESYLGEGKAYKAYDVLKGCSSPPNRYKFALTCVKLNRLSEAEKVLLDQNNIRSLSLMDPEHLKKVPNGAAGLYLLGHIREHQSKQKEAAKNYRQALKLDPTLWCAFERLCSLQPDEVEAQKIFSQNHPFIQHLNMALAQAD